jgi:branched-chain amino acid aminotransferase
VVEEAISPFDLQKADELFITKKRYQEYSHNKIQEKEVKCCLSEVLWKKLNQSNCVYLI